MATPALLSWSGGKDAAWALHVLRQAGEIDVVGLLTTVAAAVVGVLLLIEFDHGDSATLQFVVDRSWIELIGHLFFLLPFTLVMIVTGWPFFNASWRIGEQSSNAGGLIRWRSALRPPVNCGSASQSCSIPVIRRSRRSGAARDDRHR